MCFSDSMTMGTSDEVRKALQEASQMAYVRGRWIYSSSQYRIVTATLPSHGEYSQYNLMGKYAGQQIRSKIDSFQNANFLISQPNPMMLPLIGIVSPRRFQ